MVSTTQLKQVMATANLSDEGRAKLSALIAGEPRSMAILPEGHPVVDTFRTGSGSLPFITLSTQDVAALQDLHQYDSGLVLSSGKDAAAVVSMYLIYDDSLDASAVEVSGITK